MRNICIPILAFAYIPALSAAITLGDVPAPDYHKDIQPILASACYSCHGAAKAKAGLRLDIKAQALHGGDSGPVIQPHRPADSLLVQLVSGLDPDRLMPAKGDKLTAEQIALLRRWIEAGAPWPDDGSVANADRKDHWAFKPITRAAVPLNTPNPIDAFITQKLAATRLEMSPPADRVTLIRRVYFDLAGLPPTPEAIDQFLGDSSPGAYEAMVDRLLASPRFGERWARHWLDVVRYAESHGFEMNLPRDDIWPYRDYVVQTFNQDKPFDQFIREQLAGDALGVDPATGFLVAGPWDQVKSPDPGLTAQQRADELNDMVATTSTVFLGMTVGCARCHDHKFDPISQTDYARMSALFAGVHHGERTWHTPGWEQRQKETSAARDSIKGIERDLAVFLLTPEEKAKLRPAVKPTVNEDGFPAVEARLVRFTINATNNSEPCIDELEIFSAGDNPRNLALASAGAKVTASTTLPDIAIHKLEHINDGRYGNSHSWISNEPGRGQVTVQLAAPAKIDRVVWGRDREGKFKDRLATDYSIEVGLNVDGPWQTVSSSADRLPFTPGLPKYFGRTPDGQKRLNELLARKKSTEERVRTLAKEPMVYAGKFSQPGPTYKLFRGDPLAPREAVTPGGLAVLAPPLDLPADSPEQQRRLALGDWLADPGNPLVARVIVNRLWQHHFGRGLVTTPSDFGHMGSRPTHPELLDFLASELIRNHWHLKPIHRLMVTAAAYRQASGTRAEAAAVDADASLLWRFPPQRLDAEAIHDAVMAVSGTLDLKMGGPGYDMYKPNDNYVRIYEPREDFGPDQFRRMIYQFKPRMQPDGVFSVFDVPDGAQTAPRRSVSTTPLQALNMLNSSFMLQQADFLAARLQRQAGTDPAAQVALAFRLVLARSPAPAETAAAIELIHKHGLPAFCRAIFNANEFIYVY